MRLKLNFLNQPPVVGGSELGLCPKWFAFFSGTFIAHLSVRILEDHLHILIMETEEGGIRGLSVY
jgi:hypothetical protein